MCAHRCRSTPVSAGQRFGFRRGSIHVASDDDGTGETQSGRSALRDHDLGVARATRVQWVVATLLLGILPGSTIGGGKGALRAAAGQAGACPVVAVPRGAAEAPGAGAAGRRAAMRSSLDAGGPAPDASAAPGVAAAAQPPPSGRPRQDLSQGLGRGFPAEGLAGPGVQLRRDRVQVLFAVHGQVGALGEVLAQQPVGVLVAAPLPGRMRIAEVDVGPPRVFRTAELVLFHAASCRFRYSLRASCGVRYPSAEWRRI